MAARRSSYLSKPGQYGTLYRWAIAYEYEPGQPAGDWHCWAYSPEHALDKWYEENDGDYRRTGEPRKVKAL